MQQSDRVFNRLTIVAALGYFVDLYDMALYNLVKKESLMALGFAGQALIDAEISLFSWQNTGMLVGGLLWGIGGDKRGRLTVLFGSIFLYSVANIANAFVTDYYSYALCRLLAGIGLAGELGAGITLVSESLTKEKRGYGTMMVVGFGLLGGVTAAFCSRFLDWQTNYLVGGAMGLVLLLLRIGTFEPTMFLKTKMTTVARGNFLMLLHPPRLGKYVWCIAIGLPIWFCSGILIAFADRLAQGSGVLGVITIANSAVFYNLGVSSGDFLSGWLSQVFKSRRRVILGFQLALLGIIFVYLLWPGVPQWLFYFFTWLIGLGAGYWAVFVTNAAEQFGTNIRSTVSNTVPNFVRGALVPMGWVFAFLYPKVGMTYAALFIGITVSVVAIYATFQIEETYGKDLDYVEE